MKTILHISDIHTSTNLAKGNNSVQLTKTSQALLDDIRELNLKVDGIIISGDIAQSGTENEYDTFNKSFLAPIKEALSVNNEFIFVCPGNHDVTREKWSATQKIARNAIQNDPEGADAFIGEIAHHMPWMENYEKFKSSIDANKKIIYKNDVVTIYDISKKALISLNSACLSTGDDRGKLFIGQYALDEIISKTKSYKDKIIIMHHPIEWLNEIDRSRLYSFIAKNNVKILLFGHMHEHSIISEKTFNEEGIVKIQAGKFDHTDRKDCYTGYSIITLHEETNIETGSILLRRFDSEKNTFKPWEERGHSTINFSIGDAPPFNSEEFSRISQKIEESLEYDIICNVGCKRDQQKKLTEIFIDPNLEAINPNWQGEEAESQDEGTIDFSEITTNNKSYLVFGSESIGKSSMLKYITIKELQKQKSGQIDRMVFYIDCHNTRFKSGVNVLKKVSDFYLEETSDTSIHAKIKSKIKNGSAILLIDSLDTLEPSSIKAVLEFIAENQSNKFILCASQNSRFDIEATLAKFAKENPLFCSFKNAISIINIGGIKRKNLRQLVGRWNGNHALPGGVKIRKYLENVHGTGLGHNPFVYSILLSIYEKKAAVRNSYLHEADIVENFIETLLEKHNTHNKNTPQYRDLILLLGYIAHNLYQKNSTEIPHTDLSEITINFIRNNYQEFEFTEYLSALTQSGVLKKNNGHYLFTQQCFYHYSLAYLATKSQNIYTEITSTPTILKNGKTIEYIAAIQKNDEALIKTLDKLCHETALQILEEKQICIPPADEILTHKVNDCGIARTLAGATDNSARPETDDDTDEIDDKEDSLAPLSPSRDESIENNHDDYSTERKFTELVSLHARLVKASEHLMSGKKTELHFRSSVSYYDLLLSFIVENFFNEMAPVIIGSLIDNTSEKETSKQNEEVEKQRAQRFLCFVASILPNYISSMMRNDLLNNRSRLVMEKILAIGKPSATEELFVKLGLCEMDDTRTIEIIKSIPTNKDYVMNSVLLKIFELTNSGDISNQTRQDLRKYLKKMSERHKVKSRYSDIMTAGQISTRGALKNKQPI